MHRFTVEERSEIIRQRKDGKSLRQICMAMGAWPKNKSTVYYHIKKNFGLRYSIVKIDRSNQELIGEITGLFASDGSAVPQSDYQVRFHLDANEEEYAIEFMSVLNDIFNKMPRIYKVKRNSLVIVYKSKIIYDFMREYLEWEGKKTYTVRLKSLHHTREFLIGFLRGYFDGDGYSKNDQRSTQFITTSKSMYDQLQNILIMFNLNFFVRVYHDKRENRHIAYYVNLRKSYAVKFINLIKPRNSKRVRKWARRDSDTDYTQTGF
jgi:hypothetical protein